MNSPQPPILIRFAVFELDLRTRELRKDGRSTGLPDQSITVLAMFLEQPGELVLREDIRTKLWPNDTVVEFDHSINTAIGRLRTALGDSAESPKYIETLPRRGYRWVGPAVSRETRELIEQNPVAAVEPTLHGFSESNLIGKKVSHYRVLEILGGGGMGVVYKAEDLKLGRRVALKFLPQELASDSGARQRFESEARSASALNHPNICTIYSVEEYEGQPFLAMELLEGQTLRDLLAARPPGRPSLDLTKLLDFATQITAGLEAAHRQGIIHRDIKPANIFVTSQDQAKILDFGLAKLSLAEPAAVAESATDPHQYGSSYEPKHEADSLTASSPFLSRTGVAMGTAGYMSPEQVRGEKLDARTDLFSFGLVLYEMATGKRAFVGATGPELKEAILTQMPNPAQKVNPGVPAKLGKIVHRALEKNREARYQAASEMRADLQNLKREIEPYSRARWWATAAAAVVLLSLIVSVIWFYKFQTNSSAALPQLKWRQLTSNSSESGVGSGSISRDGKYLAYPDTLGLHVKQIATGELQAIPLPKEIKSNTLDWVAGPWFPGGKTFLANAFPLGGDTGTRSSSGSSIWIFSLSGEPPRKLRDEAYLDSISPDGSLIAFETHNGKIFSREIWIMQSNGEQARNVFEVDEDATIGGLQWSKDGQRVVFFRQDGPDKANTYVVSGDLQGGPLTNIALPFDPRKSDNLIWLPDGRLLYSLNEPGLRTLTCNLWQIGMDQRLKKFVGKAQRLTNFSEQCIHPADSTWDSKHVVTHQWRPHSNVYLADLQAGATRISNPTRLTLDESWNDPFGWTTDSKAVLFFSTRSGSGGIFQQVLGQDIAKPIVTVKANENISANACLSPDGSWVVRHSVTDQSPIATTRVMRVPITGGSPELVLSGNLEEWPRCAKMPATLCAVAERSADRKRLVFAAFDPVKGRGREFANFPTDPKTDYHWDLSPDGTRIALIKHREGRVQILSLNGSSPQMVTPKGWDTLSSVNWSADGKGLFVSSYQQRGPVLLHMDLQGNAQILWEHPGGIELYGVPSPDGRHLAMRGWNVESNLWMMENF
jgi:serine/threonine protein kinase